MFEKVKDHLNEVIDIADKCPEKYQVKCFEILLDALAKAATVGTGLALGAPVTGVQVAEKPEPPFFSQYGISEDEWTRLFHFDGTSYAIIASDLKEKATSKKQVKLALLLGVKGLIETGQATILKESLIDICKEYAVHDSSNFSAHMKKQKNLFSQKGTGWVLTVPGQKQAAEVIKELAQ